MTTTNPPAGVAGSYRVGDLDLNRVSSRRWPNCGSRAWSGTWA